MHWLSNVLNALTGGTSGQQPVATTSTSSVTTSAQAAVVTQAILPVTTSAQVAVVTQASASTSSSLRRRVVTTPTTKRPAQPLVNSASASRIVPLTRVVVHTPGNGSRQAYSITSFRGLGHEAQSAPAATPEAAPAATPEAAPAVTPALRRGRPSQAAPLPSLSQTIEHASRVLARPSAFPVQQGTQVSFTTRAPIELDVDGIEAASDNNSGCLPPPNSPEGSNASGVPKTDFNEHAHVPPIRIIVDPPSSNLTGSAQSRPATSTSPATPRTDVARVSSLLRPRTPATPAPTQTQPGSVAAAIAAALPPTPSTSAVSPLPAIAAAATAVLGRPPIVPTPSVESSDNSSETHSVAECSHKYDRPNCETTMDNKHSRPGAMTTSPSTASESVRERVEAVVSSEDDGDLESPSPTAASSAAAATAAGDASGYVSPSGETPRAASATTAATTTVTAATTTVTAQQLPAADTTPPQSSTGPQNDGDALVANFAPQPQQQSTATEQPQQSTTATQPQAAAAIAQSTASETRYAVDAEDRTVPGNAWEASYKLFYAINGFQSGFGILKVIMWIFTVTLVGIPMGVIYAVSKIWECTHRSIEGQQATAPACTAGATRV